MKKLLFCAVAAFALAGTAGADSDLYVQIRYPGSTVDAMDERILSAVEYTVRTTPGVCGTTTAIRPDRLFLTAKLRPEGHDRRTVHVDLEHRLDALRADLPAGIAEIFVTDPAEHRYDILCSVSGKGTSMRELKLRAIDLRDELLRFPAIADVRLLGEEDESVYLSLPKDKFLISAGVTDLSKMLAGTLDVEPAGAIDIGSRHVHVRSPASTLSADDILDMPFSILSEARTPVTVMLRDHVTVTQERSFAPPETMAGVDGERAVLLAVAFDPHGGGNVVDLVLKNAAHAAPLGIDIRPIHDLRTARARTPRLFEMKAREGDRIEATDAAARDFARKLAATPGVGRVVTVSGGTDIALLPDLPPRPYAANRALLIVEPADDASDANIDRIVAEAAADRLRGLALWPVSAEAGAFGQRVERSVVATDPTRLEKLAAEMTEKARARPGVRLATNDWGERVESLRYNLYESRARQLGLTSRDVSRACRLAIEGMEISSCWDRGDRLPVVLRIDKKDVSGPQDLETLWVRSSFANRAVPFSQIITGYESVSEPGCRRRENGRYVVRLLAYADDARTADELRQEWARLSKGL